MTWFSRKSRRDESSNKDVEEFMLFLDGFAKTTDEIVYEDVEEFMENFMKNMYNLKEFMETFKEFVDEFVSKMDVFVELAERFAKVAEDSVDVSKMTQRISGLYLAEFTKSIDGFKELMSKKNET